MNAVVALHRLMTRSSESFRFRCFSPSHDIGSAFSFVSSPRAVHCALQRSDEVGKLRRALKSGEVTEEAIRVCIAELLSELETGRRLPHELAIAAITVALECRPSPFAEEFILDLARLKLAELPIAIRVARRASEEWLQLSGSKSKFFTLADPETSATELKLTGIAPEVLVDDEVEWCNLGAF